MLLRQDRPVRLGRALLIAAALCLLWSVPVLADDRGRGQNANPKQDDSQPAEVQTVIYAPLIAAGSPAAEQTTSASFIEGIDDGELQWVFVDESKPGAPVPDAARIEFGAQTPAGETTVHFVLNSRMEAISLQNQDTRLRGLRLADLSALAYCTYLADAPMPYAVMLQLNIDGDVSDDNHAWQGRLVYDPARNGAIVQGEWQCWDTLSGVWWATSGPLSSFATPESPQPLAALLDEAPNLGLHPEYAALVLRAGDGWQRFDGYADGVLLGVGEESYLFDFEIPKTPKNDQNEEERQAARNDGNDDDAGDRDDDRDDRRDKDSGADRKNRRDNNRRDLTRLINLIDFDVDDLCKRNAWRLLGFRNQGQCISYLNYLEKQPRLFERLRQDRD